MQPAPRAANTVHRPISGVGVGLRHKHVPHILNHLPKVPWFELLADNWLAPGGLNREYLTAVAEHYPITLHGVNLNLGGTEPLDFYYLEKIQQLMELCKTQHYSEHACFTQFQNQFFHDLLPVPFHESVVHHMADRIQQTQQFLGCKILIENVSSYVRYQENQFDEVDFLTRLTEYGDCYLLLDMNNLYVNEINHHESLRQKLAQLPLHRIKEIHLAGHEQRDGFLLDTHSRPVCDDVWEYYEHILTITGALPTLIEWDHDLPEWPQLEQEQRKASAIMENHQTEAVA